ncbi:MAG: hypothetical protein JXR76_31120 [Deltaproteobacteria bacterium]|nr:hypothetical protein [Deltaproteobacteria bacterium]
MTTRHLEKIRAIIKEATDLDISYAYDDLVFPDHSAFLIQFDDSNPDHYFCYFHEDMNPDDKAKLTENLHLACQMHKCSVTFKGAFNLKQKGAEVDILFM